MQEKVTEPMRMVSHHVVDLAVGVIDGLQIDEDELLRPFAFDPGALRHKRVALSWDELTEILDRCVERTSLSSVCNVLQSMNKVAPSVQSILATFVSPLRLYRFINNVMGPAMYPMLASDNRIHKDGTVELLLTLRDGFRACRNFFVATAATQVGIPSFIGLPNAQLQCIIEPRRGHYLLTPPGSKTVGARILRSAKHVFARQALAELETNKRLLRQSYDDFWERVDQHDTTPQDRSQRLGQVSKEWMLTPRQSEILDGLTRGLANKELAQELGCSVKTVEAHVGEIFRRSGATTRSEVVARFWGQET